MKRTPRTIIGIVLGALILLGGVFAFSHAVSAATALSIENIGGSIGLTSTDFKAVVINVIRWALGILTLVAVSFIIYGGFLWLTSNGNEKQIEKAKRVILNAVVGLIIVLIAWAIVFFVAKTVLNTTDGTSGGGDPACCLPPGDADTGFEIRSITTDCGTPPDYRSDVYRCSAVQVTFNHQVNAATVQAAVNNGTLVIKQCATDSCLDAGLSIPASSSVDAGLTSPDRQAYTPNAPSGTTAEWVAKSDNTGKTVTFFHINRLFETGNPSFHVSIPTSIQDTDGKSITNCQISTGVPVPGCTPDGAPVTRFTWTMKVGNNVDTNPPKRTASYPTSAYKAPGAPVGAPDENVPRSPIMSIAYDQAILGTIDQSHNADPADRLNNTVAIIPFTPNTTTPNPEDQTAQGDPIDPNDYLVVLSPDSTTLQIAFKAGRQMEKFQWYRIQVQGVRDLCSNLQSPEPFSWVFETNDVVPAVADHFPRNGTGIDAGTTAACSDTPIFIRYTTSMYDIANSTCRVPLGYVTQGQIAPPVSRNFDVDPSQSCNGCADPQNRCMVYTFTPPPPVPPAAGLMNPGTTYGVGVDNRFVVNDSGGTLRFGSGTWGDAALGAWKFRVGPAGSCINPPVITSIDPSQGTDGQCITVGGFNFDPNTNGRTGGDELTYDGGNVPGGNILGWVDTQIASEVPAGGTGVKNFTVKADFPAPFGNLESPAFPWTKLAGSASTGPCLANVSPATGYNLDNVTLNGKRFDPTSTLKRVSWNTVNQNNPVGWTDEQIATSVPSDPPLIAPIPAVSVRVQNDNGLSNRVYYNLQDLVIPPGTPEPPVVVDRWPNCGASCVNADVGARFAYPSGAALTLDPTSLPTGTAVLKRCTTDACTAYTGADITPAITYDGAPTNIIHFPPSATLLPDTAYRAILKGSIKDTPAGTPLGQLNFDEDGTGGNDSYSWIFKTQAGAGGCRLGRVDVVPNPDTFTSNGELHNYAAGAFTEPNSCSASGQPMNPAALAWNWTSDPAYVTAAPSGWTSDVTAVAETIPGPPTIVSATAREGAITKTGNASVTIDFSLCSASTDCTQGGACGGSVCDNATRRCTPVITSINPVQGAIGTWVGVNGCYFGGYARGTCSGGTNAGAACDANTDCNSNNCVDGSAVIFSGDKRNLWPNPAMCGAPSVQWHEDNVTVEVPDRGSAARSASSGPIVLQRWDGQRSAASAQSYVVDPAVIVPGICSVSPAGGSEGTSVTLVGQQFGATKAVADRVTFYQEHDVPAGDITSWADNQIVCRAPNGIANNTSASYEYPAGRPWGQKEIAVQAGGQWSNVADFNIVPPGCQVCTADAVCGVGNSCGYNGCCTSAPTVTAVSPTNGQANICRNSAMTATFSRAMDLTTLNSSTVHVFKGGIEVAASVGYDGATNKATITAGLLDRNTTYTVSLSQGNLVQNSSFEQALSPTWNPVKSSQSNDLPPGAVAGSRSALVDGAAAPVGQGTVNQAIGTVTNLQRTYHVTGWVKYRNVNATGSAGSAWGGLITRCIGDDASGCTNTNRAQTFDKYNDALVITNPNFGLFTQNSPGYDSGWHRVDFTVSNTSGLRIAPQINCFANSGSQVLCDDIIVTEVGTSGVRAADGGNLAAYQWTFQTADAAGPCGVTRVDISPSQWSFNKAAQPQTFTARAFADSGLEVVEIPGVYEWRWNWSVIDNTIADFTAAPGDSSSASVAARPKKGTTFLKAEVQPVAPARGLTAPVGGLASLNSTACEDLWLGSQFTDSAANCRAGTGTCSDFHFNLSYCKDGGLPSLDNNPTITGQAAGSSLLKEYLFKEPGGSVVDAIGIRIYANPQKQSAAVWYQQNAPRPSPSTNPIAVDGYDAVQDGRTIYIGASDFNGSNFFSYIFVLSMTPNASAGVQNIYNQFIQNWFFNNNVNGICHDAPVYPTTESNKTCVQRDLKRLAALSDITQALRTYRTKNGSYPKIESGSFLPQLSFSTWPSWKIRLGGDIGISMPVDPKNGIVNCPAGQAQDGTCWNETNKKFVCLPDAPANSSPSVSAIQSHIFGYQGSSTGATASLFANLEYRGTGNWMNFEPGTSSICSSPSTCKCFNYSFGP